MFLTCCFIFKNTIIFHVRFSHWPIRTQKVLITRQHNQTTERQNMTDSQMAPYNTIQIFAFHWRKLCYTSSCSKSIVRERFIDSLWVVDKRVVTHGQQQYVVTYFSTWLFGLKVKLKFRGGGGGGGGCLASDPPTTTPKLQLDFKSKKSSCSLGVVVGGVWCQTPPPPPLNSNLTLSPKSQVVV